MELIQFFVQLQQQFRILHWETKSYARHKAYGDIYGSLDDLVDTFMETYMGKYGRNIGNNSASMINYDASNAVETVKAFEAFLISLTSQLQETDTDLLNIRDEMLALVHKTQYLLTLS